MEKGRVMEERKEGEKEMEGGKNKRRENIK